VLSALLDAGKQNAAGALARLCVHVYPRSGDAHAQAIEHYRHALQLAARPEHSAGRPAHAYLVTLIPGSGDRVQAAEGLHRDSMFKSHHVDGTISGQLDRLESSLVRGRLGESARLRRLRIDGRWYFCTASSFADSTAAGAVLRHTRLPVQVTVAAYVARGRNHLYWLYNHDSGAALEPWTLRRAGISIVTAWLAPVFGVALYVFWQWVNHLSKTLFVVLLPVTLLLSMAAVFSALLGVFGLMDAFRLFWPRRLRAYRAYLALRRTHSHDR
jgi:hypothetical protein